MEREGKCVITIRAFHNEDLDAVLELIKRSDSTDRTCETWLGNNMTAMLAFDHEKLIGAIPFEKRSVVLDKDQLLKVLWVSAAHVDSAYRSQGIGSKMDQAIEEYFYPEFEAVLVCREDESSPAYRWYMKLGYQPLVPIVSLKKMVEGVPENGCAYVVWNSKQDIQSAGNDLLRCFNRNTSHYGGFPERTEQFWARKLDVHYYKSFYTYYVVAVMDGQNIAAYALLGQGAMKDKIERFDILEMITPEAMAIKKNLQVSIMDFAQKKQLKEVRIQLADQDCDLEWLRSLGFSERWRTNILGKMICSDKPFPEVRWKYFHVDYI